MKSDGYESSHAILVHRDFKPLYANSRFAALFGYSDPNEILSLDSVLEALWSPQDRKAIQTIQVPTPNSSSHPVSIQCHNLKKDGSLVWLNNQIDSIDWHGEDATQVSVFESGQSMYDSLFSSEHDERFRLVFDQQFQFMILLSPDGKVIDINELPLSTLGGTREQFIGHYFWETPGWAGLEEWQGIIRSRVTEVVDHAKNLDVEDIYQTQDGSIRYTSASYTGIRDEHEKLKYILVQARDITDHKFAEMMLHDNRQRLDLALAAASMGTWEWSITSHRVIWSPETSKIFGIQNSGLESSFDTYLSLIPDGARQKIEIKSREIIKNAKENEMFKYEHEIVRPDNSRGWVEVRGKIFYLDCGKVVRIAGICMDISESKRAQKELTVLHRAMESSSSSVIIINTERKIEYVNSKFTQITGYSKSEVLGKSFDLLKSGKMAESVYVDLWDMVSSGMEWKGEIHNRKKDGTLYWERSSISCVKNEFDEITHYIAIQEDVTHEYELSEKINYQASHDSLTGLINRYEFERHIQSVPAASGDEQVQHALCFLDLDQFKLVNDTCGHIAGDGLLRQLCPILQDVVGDRGILARLGGDEFAIFLENCSLDNAQSLATSVLEAVKDFQYTWEDHIFRLGVSIGLVPIDTDIPKISELLKQADTACYMAKDLGRNRIHVYYPDDIELAQRSGEMQWANRIYHALDNDKFQLHAQVIAPLKHSNRCVYELLVRMEDDTGDLIPPGAFIPAAERFNLISKIDCWVVKNGLSLMSQHKDFLDSIEFVSINLSGQSLADETVRDFVITQIAKLGLDANKICFEITETAAVLDLSVAEDFITALKFMGCRFALDDFGSGVSSFGYLKKLPVDYLKIDGMFVKDIADDPIDHAMVKSINEIGHVMGMMTIAEFVENEDIESKLKSLGVDYAQGFGIGRPKSFERILNNKDNDVY